MKLKGHCIWNTLSIAALAFGCGILLAFFLPEEVLVVIEALLIALVGGFCFIKKR